MSIIDETYTRLPGDVQPLVKHGYYLLHPALSWRKMRKVDRTTESFVERFFESEDEFEGFGREFFEGPIVDICRRAMNEVDDERTIYDAHRDECLKLYSLIRKRKPDAIVETGVYHGVSTASMLVALDENGAGTLFSIAGSAVHEPNVAGAFEERRRPSCAEAGTHTLPPGKDPGWIIPDELRDRWKVTTGRPRRELPSLLEDVGGIDLFFHDSEHSTSGMLFEFVLAWEWLTAGGVLLSCHVDWNDAFETFVEEHPTDYGLVSFEYGGREGYDEPCSCSYAIKPSEDRPAETGTRGRT